jgi:hypothetical protein
MRLVGLVAAVGLIMFGSAANLLRTVKFGLEKIISKN